jgi:hypothetical protein
MFVISMRKTRLTMSRGIGNNQIAPKPARERGPFLGQFQSARSLRPEPFSSRNVGGGALRNGRSDKIESSFLRLRRSCEVLNYCLTAARVPSGMWLELTNR